MAKGRKCERTAAPAPGAYSFATVGVGPKSGSAPAKDPAALSDRAQTVPGLRMPAVLANISAPMKPGTARQGGGCRD